MCVICSLNRHWSHGIYLYTIYVMYRFWIRFSLSCVFFPFRWHYNAVGQQISKNSSEMNVIWLESCACALPRPNLNIFDIGILHVLKRKGKESANPMNCDAQKEKEFKIFFSSKNNIFPKNGGVLQHFSILYIPKNKESLFFYCCDSFVKMCLEVTLFIAHVSYVLHFCFRCVFIFWLVCAYHAIFMWFCVGCCCCCHC